MVRTGSVTGAAQVLNVSPPAVTLQMQLLQDQAGLPLVERNAASGHTIDSALATKNLTIPDVAGLPILRQWCVAHLRQRRLMPAAAVRAFFIEEGRRYLPDVFAPPL